MSGLPDDWMSRDRPLLTKGAVDPQILDHLRALLDNGRSAVLATVSSRIALRYAPMLGLEISPVPVTLNFPPVAMVWTLQTDADAGAVWLRQQIREAMVRNVDGGVSGIAA